MQSLQLQEPAGRPNWHQVSGSWDSLPLLENTSALHDVLNGERSIVKIVEEARFKVHQGW